MTLAISAISSCPIRFPLYALSTHGCVPAQARPAYARARSSVVFCLCVAYEPSPPSNSLFAFTRGLRLPLSGDFLRRLPSVRAPRAPCHAHTKGSSRFCVVFSRGIASVLRRRVAVYATRSAAVTPSVPPFMGKRRTVPGNERRWPMGRPVYAQQERMMATSVRHDSSRATVHHRR